MDITSPGCRIYSSASPKHVTLIIKRKSAMGIIFMAFANKKELQDE
jgi:hypothetical protein